MVRVDSRSTVGLFGLVATAAAYFVLATASLLWTRASEGIATMWPAGGFAVAVLASVPRRHIASHALAVAVASLAGNHACGIPPALAATFTVANVTETLVAVGLLARCPFGTPSFVDVRQIGRSA